MKVPISVDAGLLAAAQAHGQAQGRDAAEQLEHWARLGRELDASTAVCKASIAAVLGGSGSYDELHAAEQVYVRVAWATGIADGIAGLDLAAEFEAAGQSWSDADGDGNPVIRTSATPRSSDSDRTPPV